MAPSVLERGRIREFLEPGEVSAERQWIATGVGSRSAQGATAHLGFASSMAPCMLVPLLPAGFLALWPLCCCPGSWAAGLSAAT